MKKYLLFISILVILSCGGDVEIAPGDTYVKYFGDGINSLELKDMVLKPNGEGVVLLGDREGELEAGEIFKRFYLVSTDGDGNAIEGGEVQLQKLNGDGLEDPEHMEASRITAIDGGYLVVGTMEQVKQAAPIGSRKTLAFWAELDDNLDIVGQWMSVGDTISNYHGVDINVTSDGGVLVAGYTDTNGDNDFFYSKIGGTTDEWERIQPRASSDDQLIRAMATSAGQFALFGRTDALSEDGETGVNVERTIIDQEGVIVNSLVYGTSVELSGGIRSSYDDIPYDVIEKPGGFTIVGEAGSLAGAFESSPFLMNVDLTGAVSVEENYALDFAEAPKNRNPKTGGARSVTQTLSNDFVVIGDLIDYTAFPGDKKLEKFRNDEVMIMRTNQAGIQVSSITSFGVENGDDRAVRALTAADGTILVGATYDFGGGITQFALLKMNVQGELKQ